MKDVDILDQAKKQARPTPSFQPEQVQQESINYRNAPHNPLSTLVDLTISPEDQNAYNQQRIKEFEAYNQEKSRQLEENFQVFVNKASHAKALNKLNTEEQEQIYLKILQEEKAKIAAENETNLRELARLAAESEMNYYGVGKHNSNLFHQTQIYQISGDRTFQMSTTTIIPRLGASENGNNGNKGFGK